MMYFFSFDKPDLHQNVSSFRQGGLSVNTHNKAPSCADDAVGAVCSVPVDKVRVFEIGGSEIVWVVVGCGSLEWEGGGEVPDDQRLICRVNKTKIHFDTVDGIFPPSD